MPADRVAAVASAALLWLGSTMAAAADFTGFWKGDCSDAFGIQIKPYDSQTYSVSFCGPGGCFSPGTWRPNSAIEGDPSYKVIDAQTLDIRGGNGWQRYTKCTTETNPALSYSTMRVQGPKADEPARRARVKAYYREVPDYEKQTVFRAEPAGAHAELRALLAKAPVGSELCVRGRVTATVAPPHELRTNICDRGSYSRIKSVIAQMAPALDRQRWTFRKADLDADGEPEVIVEHVDLIGDENVKDPYLSLWHLRHDGAAYRATYAGPFLAGGIHAQLGFGESRSRKMVFVRHSSCTECHAWVYLTVIDFLRNPNGAAFEFTYAEDHKAFGHNIEYALPGMGHSVDAKVETRSLPAASEGPHLLQRFRFDDGRTEWWVFRCLDLRCDYELYEDLPIEYRQAWQRGRKI